MLMRAVVAARAPPLALDVQRGAAVTAVAVAEVEASAVYVAAPVDARLSFHLSLVPKPPGPSTPAAVGSAAATAAEAGAISLTGCSHPATATRALPPP